MSNQSLRISTLISKSQILASKHAIVFIAILSLVNIPMYLVYFFTIEFFGITSASVSTILANLFNIFIGVLATSAIYGIVKDSLEHKQISLLKTLRSSLVMWPAIISTQFVLTLFSLPLYLAFVIPGLVFAIHWMFSVQVSVYEGKFGYSALKRSKQLVQGRWSQFFSFMLVLMVLKITLLIPFGTIITMFAGHSLIVFVGLSFLRDIVLIPFTIAQSLLYFYAVKTYRLPVKKGQQVSPSLQKAAIQ